MICAKMGPIIREILPTADVSSTSTDELLIINMHGGVTFDHLAAIAKRLHTNSIDICSENDGLGCSTCGNGAGVNRWLEVKGWKL